MAKTPLPATDFMLLLVLVGGESYGYRIVRQIRERSDGEIDLLPGNLYAILNRMEDGGLIERSERRAAEGNGPPRRYYAITPQGREVAAAEVERLQRLMASDEVRQLTGEPAK